MNIAQATAQFQANADRIGYARYAQILQTAEQFMAHKADCEPAQIRATVQADPTGNTARRLMEMVMLSVANTAQILH